MPLSAIGPKFVTFTGEAPQRDNADRKERVGEAAAVTGGVGAGYTATRGAAFKMFRSSERLRGTINTLAEGVNVVNKPLKQTNSLWNALKVNYRQMRLDIAQWAKASKMPKFMKAVFTGKLGAVLGGGAAVFVFISGVSEVFNTFLNKLSTVTDNPNV